MLFSFGIVKSNAELSHSIMCFLIGLNIVLCFSVLDYDLFYIVLCPSVLDYVLLHCVMRNQIMLSVAIVQFCSCVLYYGLLYGIMLFCVELW